MHRHRILFRFFFITLVLGCAGSHALAEPQAVLDAVKKSEVEVTAASGKTVVTTRDIRPSTLAGGHDSESTTTYTWEFQGRDWREETGYAAGLGTSSAKSATQVVHDERVYRYAPDSKVMQVYDSKARGKASDHPLWAQYIGLGHMLDAVFPSPSREMTLANAEETGTDTIDGVAAVVLSGTSPIGQDVKWWLAPIYGYRILRCETRWSATNSKTDKEYLVVDEFSKFVEVAQGISLPSVKNVTKTVIHIDGTTTDTLKITGTTSYASVNKAIDPAEFVVTPAPGTAVHYTDDVEIK